MKVNLKDYSNADVIKFLREYRNMTQKELASILNRNVRTIQRYEAGEINIDLETIKNICKLFDLNLIIESKKQKEDNVNEKVKYQNLK